MNNPKPISESTPLERFTEAMRHIMAVPKSEVEKRSKEYRKQRRAQRKRHKKAT